MGGPPGTNRSCTETDEPLEVETGRVDVEPSVAPVETVGRPNAV